MSQTKVQLINDVSGDSGFGLASAESVLHVSKTVSAGSDNFALRIQNPTNASDARVGVFFHVNAVTGSGSDGAYIESANSGSNNGDIRFGSITDLTKTERMRIDSSGNIKIGETNSGAVRLSLTQGSNGGLMISKGVSTTPTNGQTIGDIGFSSYSDGQTNSSSEAMIRAVAAADHSGSSAATDLVFFTKPSSTGPGSSPTERIRINSGGRVLVGTNNPVANGVFEVVGNIGFNDCLVGYRRSNDDTSNRAFTRFQSSNGTQIGFIGMGSSSVSYNTSSDYRMKENVVAISDGITRLKTLKPSRFNFLSDTSTTLDGFLAHEVSSIVPEAITGEKDAVDSDNKPIYQGIDQSKLVPLITAALQEEIAKREALETRVATLEAA